MNKCLKCKKETENPRFCSLSCAAIFNNTGTHRGPRKTKFYKCKVCNKDTTQTRRQYCCKEHKKIGLLERKKQLRRSLVLEENKVFIENSLFSRKIIRNYIIKRNIEINGCDHTLWNGEILTKDLHHKNGIQIDNRKENLEWLCPNCHSLTKNYKFKNGNKRKCLLSSNERTPAP